MNTNELKKIIRDEILTFIDRLIEQEDSSCVKEEISGTNLNDAIDGAFEKMQNLTRLGCAVNDISKVDGSLKNAIKTVLYKDRYYNNEFISFTTDLIIELLFADQTTSTNAIIIALKEVINEAKAELADKINLPEQLSSPEAINLLNMAVEANYLDNKYQLKVSRPIASVLADHIGKLLNIDKSIRWKPFAELWNIPDLAKSHQKAINSKSYEKILHKIKLNIY